MTGGDRMNTKDPIDDLLTAAGERWRATQPDPPEPDPTRWVTRVEPARQRWLAPVSAAAATILVAGALVFAAHQGGRLPDVPVIRPAGPAALIVRDGDLVEATGRVESRPQGTQFCAPAPVAEDSCPYSIAVSGVDPAAEVHLRGTWHPGALTGIEKLAVRSAPPSPDVVFDLPCAAPAGGWRTDEDADNPVVWEPINSYLTAHPQQYAAPYVAYAGPAHVLVVQVVSGDVDQARTALKAIYPANLCVVGRPGHRSIADDQELAATVGKPIGELMNENSLGIYLAQPEDGRMLVKMVQLTPALYDKLAAIGLNRLIIDPWLRPAGR
jgi:hypothetical protein